MTWVEFGMSFLALLSYWNPDNINTSILVKTKTRIDTNLRLAIYYYLGSKIIFVSQPAFEKKAQKDDHIPLINILNSGVNNSIGIRLWFSSNSLITLMFLVQY